MQASRDGGQIIDFFPYDKERRLRVGSVGYGFTTPLLNIPARDWLYELTTEHPSGKTPTTGGKDMWPARMFLILITYFFASCSGMEVARQGVPSQQQPVQVMDRAWLTVIEPAAVPAAAGTDQPAEHREAISVSDPELRATFAEFKVQRFFQALPFARTPALRDVYEVHCDCDVNLLIETLRQRHDDLIGSVTLLYESRIKLYEPADYMWWLLSSGQNDWLWYLDRIQASEAWDVTRCSTGTRIAILDTEFDITHPDLSSELDPDHDPWDGVPFDCSPVNPHGTAVASLASGETTATGGTSQGQLASIGFDSGIIGYRAWVNTGDYLKRAVHASTVMNADVITSSAGGWSRCPDSSGVEALAVKEILDNGTTIVMPAGNGNNGTHNTCPDIDPVNHTAFFPLSPHYDERVILVTGTAKNDRHYFNPSGANDLTHSHYPMVDLAAPGHEIMAAGETGCGANPWPYWGGWGGTSFAAPITAGVAALVLCANPCLSPADVQEILKGTTDPIVDAADFPGQVGTGRLNAFRAVQRAEAHGVHPPVTGTETWNDDRFVQGDLVVEHGGKLTVTNRLRFATGARLIVKPGAELVVDGGTLTVSSGCHGGIWRGIEVWGEAHASQFPTRNQGYLRLMNGAVIEHAEVGVSVWSPGDPSSTGGIVLAEDATFRDCKRSVEFGSYQNFHPIHGRPMDNRSNFSLSTFETTGRHLRNGDTPEIFVTNWGCDGVDFQGCTFRHLDPPSAPDQRGRGIKAVNARFRVSNACTSPTDLWPCNSWTSSTFEGLQVAVDVLASQPLKPVTIQDSTFDGNHGGILLRGVDFATLTDNSFRIDEAAATLYPFGIFMDHTSKFKVEGNRVESTHQGSSIGLYIRDSGDATNETYMNDFSNLAFATLFNGDNDGPEVFDGLQILCHDYGGNLYDIAVLDGDIGLLQGSCSGKSSTPAGNLFSRTCDPGTNNEYFAFDTQQPILYHHHSSNGRTLPECYSEDGVHLYDCNVPFVECGPRTPDCDTTACWLQRHERAQAELSRALAFGDQAVLEGPRRREIRRERDRSVDDQERMEAVELRRRAALARDELIRRALTSPTHDLPEVEALVRSEASRPNVCSQPESASLRSKRFCELRASVEALEKTAQACGDAGTTRGSMDGFPSEECRGLRRSLDRILLQDLPMGIELPPDAN